MTRLNVSGHAVTACEIPRRARKDIEAVLARLAADADRQLDAATGHVPAEALAEVRTAHGTASDAVRKVAVGIRRATIYPLLFTGAFLALCAACTFSIPKEQYGAVAFVVAVALYITAQGALMSVMSRLGKIGPWRDSTYTHLFRVAGSRMLATEGGVHCVVMAPEFKVEVTTTAYADIGHCGRQAGDLVLCDRFGVELARVPGVPESLAVPFATLVRSRIPQL